MTTTDTEATETTADRFGLTDRPRRSLGLAGLARRSPDASASTSALTLDSIPDPSAAPVTGERLTDAERKDLATCESVIRSHHASFWMTGKALDAVANRHLYRAEYPTFDDLLKDWDISLADSSRMRRGWRLAARLLPEVPKLTRSHVVALLPVVDQYGVEAAATLHGLLREALPKVTAKAIDEIVRELPGPRGEAGDPVDQIREQAEKALTEPDQNQDDDQEDPADAALRQAVSQRSRQLADDLKRGRIPRRELNRALAEAFVDTEDPRVYQALVRWMKDRDRKISG